MSKRSISRKINLNFPLPEPHNLPNSRNSSDKCIQEVYFGEKVDDNAAACSCSSNTSGSESVSSNVIRETCSGSSTSGEDELEIEAVKKISEEFDKLDLYFYGEENLTTTNDDEYNLWKEKFPYLRVIGSAMKIYPQPQSSNCEEQYVEGNKGDFYEEIIAEHSDCNIPEFKEKRYNKAKIKEAVLNHILKETSLLLSKKRQRNFIINTSQPQNAETLPITSFSDVNEPEIEDIMYPNNYFEQIPCSTSTLTLNSSPFRKPTLEYQSPIMRSHLSASKWQRHDSTDAASLPCISNHNVPYSAVDCRRNSSLSANKLDIKSSRKRSDSSINKLQSCSFLSSSQNITLPPIKNSSLIDTRERSVSSTPRKYSSTHQIWYSDFLDKNKK